HGDRRAQQKSSKGTDSAPCATRRRRSPRLRHAHARMTARVRRLRDALPPPAHGEAPHGAALRIRPSLSTRETLAAACSLQKVRANASKRVAFVTDEILGVTKNAGAATANTFLALKLADLGYVVEVRFAAPLGAEGVRQPWRREYY